MKLAEAPLFDTSEIEQFMAAVKRKKTVIIKRFHTF